jgi:large subunit ribosomal protein L24e
MVVKRQCSFCAREVEPGTGTMFVKRDGTVFHFCSSSCRKQQLNLGRVGHRFKWTRAHALKRSAERSSAERAPAAPPPPKRAARRPPAEKAPAAPAAPAEAPPAPAPAAVAPRPKARKPKAASPAKPES